MAKRKAIKTKESLDIHFNGVPSKYIAPFIAECKQDGDRSYISMFKKMLIERYNIKE